MTLLAVVQERAGLHIPTWSMGDRLRKAREDAGLTQQELAEITTISHTSIKNYEAGKRTPRALYLRAWAEATGVPVEWLETGTAPADAGAEVEPPAGIEPATYSLQGNHIPECPDTVSSLVSRYWDSRAYIVPAWDSEGNTR